MSNPYKALLGLLPKRPLQVGTVLSVDDGLALIEMPGGGVARARGVTTVGQRVFLRDGVIEGTAPLLPIELIEV